MLTVNMISIIRFGVKIISVIMQRNITLNNLKMRNTMLSNIMLSISKRRSIVLPIVVLSVLRHRLNIKNNTK
jgi:hypothetical protein